MDATDLFLVHLLDCALRGRTPDAALAEGVDWEALFRLAQAHKIDAMLLDAICMLPETHLPPQPVFAAWQENAMITMMGQAMLVERLHALLEAFDAAGVRAVVLKGVALKLLYPQPDLRTMSDADLLVKQSAFTAARAVMEAEGYALVEQEPGVDILRGPEGLRVELHAQLFDKTAYGFLSRLDEAKMFPIENTLRTPVYGGEAWVFPPLQHALFMLCHMAKHMITTGFGLRQTADFVLFAEANDASMDWPLFFGQARLLGLSSFASALLSVGMRYLSMEKGNFTRFMESDPLAAEWLLPDLLDAGVFGNRTEERRRSAAVVYRSFDEKDGDSGRIRRAIFPSATSLKAPYLYARRSRLLLPVAWIHRWANYIWSLLTGKTKRQEMAEGLKIADERLLLLDRLGLRDERSAS